MPQKSATYISFASDEHYNDLCKFIVDAGVQLHIRDMEKNPLSVTELDQLFGHNPLTYFINTTSSEYTRLGLDQKQPDRQELLEMMAENPGLLRQPIIKTTRLVTAGYNKDKIAEMLQISRNGEPQQEVSGNRGGRIIRRPLPAKK